MNRHGLHTTIPQQNVKSFLLADIGEGITDCELIQWFIEPGQTSDKATVEITSRYAGKVLKHYHNVHDIAKVGQPLVDIETDDEHLDSGNDDLATGDTPSLQTPIDVDLLESRLFQFPSVRRLATINNININVVKGTGKNGRVLKENINSHIENKGKRQENQESLSNEPLENTFGQVDSISSLSMVQKAMYKTMTTSLTIPQLGYKDEIELDVATNYRSSLNEHIARNSNMYPFTKISYLPIFVKSLSLALSYYPIMNACITGDQTDINSLRVDYCGSHNIGVAMDTPQGLIVPNIKNVQSKTIFQVAAEIHRLMELGKNNAIPLQDLKGGTITLSNIGTISGTYANPVIVSSELSIVALGKMRKLPRFDHDGRVVAKEILPISWSADHRIIDGATMTRFGNSWKELIENPALLTSELR
ncbi:2-oxoacid dehydrogenases acyltransferase-domain-containing protein [Absidia repens]|uniref:2-oxoacid dehydrogenases acyltransferase-domain-containing protein n=1 Tax=Absidia repens TaxID=90262 RepID=A0A1X2HH33_9FUNG|nr:2-oxoacid dehydrogenases acyltransferase-domain-containing protein [Absidia repens]